MVGVTWISRSEVESGRVRGILAGFVIQLAALVGLGIVAGGLYHALDQTLRFPLIGLVVLIFLIRLVFRVGLRAIQEPIPPVVQRAVKTGVLSLIWIDVALVALVRDPALGCLVAGLWVPAYLLGRWLYST